MSKKLIVFILVASSLSSMPVKSQDFSLLRAEYSYPEYAKTRKSQDEYEYSMRVQTQAANKCQPIAASGDFKKFNECMVKELNSIMASSRRSPQDLFHHDPYGRITRACKEDIQNCISRRIDESVVELLTPASSGSGVVIGDDGSSLLVATAKHVVGAMNQRELIQVSHKGKPIGQVFISDIWKHPVFDLALIRLKSRIPVAVAYVHGMQYVNNVDAIAIDRAKGAGNSSLQAGQQIFVAGYSIPSASIPSIFRVAKGDIVSISSPSAQNDGYSLVYTAPTITGMSGGAVFYTSYCLPPRGLEAYHPMFGQVPVPVVIGLHGRAETTEAKGFTGFNMAIPVTAITDAKPSKDFFDQGRFRRFFCPYGTTTSPVRFN